MNIVCFHLNQIGDLAFSLPALKCIRDSYPDAHITSVARPSGKELLECTGLVDEVLSRRGGFNSQKLGLINRLASEKYDLAIMFSQSAECALLAYLARIPKRIGFMNTSLGFLLTQKVSFQHPPSTENNLRLIEAAGCKITQGDYFGLLKPTVAQNERAEVILQSYGVNLNDKIISFSPGTSGRRRVKEWTDQGFAEVARYFAKKGYKIIILGTVSACNIVEECAEIIDLSGKTNLGEALAILAKSETLVAVDSGILHLCAATGRRVVGLYGPSNPKITGPQGDGHVVLTSNEDCSPCMQTECKYDRKCMTNIDSNAVIAAVESIVS